MTKTVTQKISRRDALKILTAAAGAAALANLPPKWSKPSLEIGVLPAHAQTSTTHTLVAGPDDPAANYCFPFGSTVTITPPTPGILMHYVITRSNSGTVIASPALTGTVPTNATGVASLTVTVNTSSIFNPGDTATVTWSFANASDGMGTSSQVFTSAGSGCPPAHTLTAGASYGANICFPTDIISTVAILPADSGIPMNYAISHSAEITIHSPAAPTGTAPTDPTGTASLTINAVTTGEGTITIVWSFANPSDGTGSGSQVITAGGC
jgi:hypothetical protein